MSFSTAFRHRVFPSQLMVRTSAIACPFFSKPSDPLASPVDDASHVSGFSLRWPPCTGVSEPLPTSTLGFVLAPPLWRTGQPVVCWGHSSCALFTLHGPPQLRPSSVWMSGSPWGRSPALCPRAWTPPDLQSGCAEPRRWGLSSVLSAGILARPDSGQE